MTGLRPSLCWDGRPDPTHSGRLSFRMHRRKADTALARWLPMRGNGPTDDARRTTHDIDEGRRLRDEARQIRRGLGASVARPREQRRRR